MDSIFERVFAAIPAIYSFGHTAKLGWLNSMINLFHTDEETPLFTEWFFNDINGKDERKNIE